MCDCDPQAFDSDAPLRLSVAAKLAFPDGSMTASGLRREAARGRLRIERIANKDFVTLAEIKRMRDLCRVPPNEHSTRVLPTNPPVPSRTEAAVSQDALRARLEQSRLQAHSKS
jgi:hypothetical protein